MPTPPQRASIPDRASVIESLRVRGSEVQLGRVLAGVCADPACARRFVRLLLRVASKDPKIGDRSAGLTVPRDITAVRELHLTRRRPGVDQQAKARADLFFGSYDFKIICELKINSDYEPKQLREYLAEGPVVGVVRDPGSRPLPPGTRAHRNWLGEVAWAEIVSGLRQLPLSPVESAQWLDLLNVLEADGDFERVKPPEISAEDRSFVLEVAERVILRLRRNRDARVRAFASQLSAAPLFDRGPWARSRITDVEQEPEEYWRIRIKDCRMRTAEVGVTWLAWTPARRGQAVMYQALQEKGFKAEYGGEHYRRTVPLDFRRNRDRLDQAADVVHGLVKNVIDVGLLEYEMNRLGIEV